MSNNATHAVPPIAPLCSGKQGGPLLGDVGKTDNAAILSELARVKALFQLRAVVACIGGGL